MEGKKKRIRKIISTIVAVALIVTMMPAADYAYGETIVPAESSDATNVDSIDPMSEVEVTEEQFFAIEKEWKADQKRRKLHRATLSGSGTVSDPYLIYTADDLQSMTDNDNSCYKLMRDIDLKGRSWRPPGYYYWYPFMGYLDGNGHKVKNLFVGGTSNDAWNINAGGFFGYLEGRVENLGIETVDVKRKGVDFFGITGGIAGVANAPSEIINCYFNGYVAGGTYVGGLVGIAYPGAVIENCCALGTVDLSQGYEYLNDNDMAWGRDVVNATADTIIYGTNIVAEIAEGLQLGPYYAVYNGIKAILTGTPELINNITSTDYLTGMRKCSIGGLVGLNYGRIYNSYAANKLYNVKTGANTKITKVGAIVARHVEGSEGEITKCYYNKDIADSASYGDSQDIDAPGKEWGKTTAALKSKKDSGLDEGQWNYSAKVLSSKSTQGYPLPKINKIKRSKRVVKKDGKTVVYEPEIYYQSRVLMKTRENYYVGEEHESEENSTESIKCTICAGLDTGSNHRAVTGIYQRGTKSRPYHVHDIDSMLGLQDHKEYNYILCDDIDFKVSDDTNTVQKYWWPVGKTHFSPSKGYFKGNTTVHATHTLNGKDVDNKINDKYKPKVVTDQKDVFTIKNLTVQTNRNAGMFACFRGTLSDINVELASGEDWKTWKDGIKGYDGKTVGISTMGGTASAGAIAGDIVTGGVIRNCLIGGPNFSKLNPKDVKPGYVNSSLRGGGVVGFLDRGAKIYNIKTYLAVNTSNYELHFNEDKWALTAKTINASMKVIFDFADPILEYFIDKYETKSKAKSYKSLDDESSKLFEKIDNGSTSGKINPSKYDLSFWVSFFKKLISKIEPLMNLWLEEFSGVCSGYIVGENYGNVNNVNIYEAEIFNPWWNFYMNWVRGDCAIGFQGYEYTYDADMLDAAADKILTNGVNIDEFNVAEFEEDYYNKINNIRVTTIATLKKGISGSGTNQDPVKIANEADLIRIAELLNSGYDFEGVYIKQVDDIVLTEPFECMGLASKTPFKGIYNGNNCVIEGLRIENNSSASLFYKLDGALVYNLVIKDGYFMGAQAAALAAEAVNETLILNCGSNSVVMAKKDKNNERNSKAAGLVLKLQDSYIGNSFVKDTVRGEFAAAGIAYTINGISELANCYVGATLIGKAENYVAAIGMEVAQKDNCCMYNCYWPEEYDAVGWNSGWASQDDNMAYSRDYMKTQAFADVLNSADNNTVSADCYIDMSKNRTWIMTDEGYPQFYQVAYCYIDVIQPEKGKIKAEYARYMDGNITWHEVDNFRLPQGTQIRLTLQNLPQNKTFDYWKINGIQNHHSSPQYIGSLHEDSVFEVALKNAVPLADQTRTLNVRIPEHGRLTLKISDVFESEGLEGPVPSSTVAIEGDKLYIGNKTISVNEKSDDSACLYSDSVLKISSRIRDKGEYILTIPYGAKIEPEYRDSRGLYWLSEYIINDSHVDEKQPGKFVCHITEDCNFHVVISTTKPEVKADIFEEQSSKLPN